MIVTKDKPSDADNDHKAAVRRLRGRRIYPENDAGVELPDEVRISKHGAFEILDILTKAGFKIIRETSS